MKAKEHPEEVVHIDNSAKQPLVENQYHDEEAEEVPLPDPELLMAYAETAMVLNIIVNDLAAQEAREKRGQHRADCPCSLDINTTDGSQQTANCICGLKSTQASSDLQPPEDLHLAKTNYPEPPAEQ